MKHIMIIIYNKKMLIWYNYIYMYSELCRTEATAWSFFFIKLFINYIIQIIYRLMIETIIWFKNYIF